MSSVPSSAPRPQLWIPGPTYVRPEILAECARPMIGHRSPEMSALIERLDPGLVLAFGLWEDSRAEVGVAPTSATGMMEGSLHGVGPRVLAVVSGAFGKRWAGIAELLGKDVRRMEVEWGQVVDDVELAEVLDREGPFDAVTMVSNETSTGVHTPIKHVSNVLQAFPDTLLLVDVVSLIAGHPIDFDESCVDFALAGVQKAFALPPGITVFCVSSHYREVATQRERPSFYLDPLKVLDGHLKRSTPATPCIPLYYALAKQLEDIDSGATLPAGEREEDGVPRTGAAAWRGRFEKHDRMRARTLAWAEGHGLAPLPPREYSSPTVSCLRAGNLDVAAFVAGLAEAGFQISNGYGPLKGKTFRIGHMGDHTEEGLAALLEAADRVIGGLRG